MRLYATRLSFEREVVYRLGKAVTCFSNFLRLVTKAIDCQPSDQAQNKVIYIIFC